MKAVHTLLYHAHVNQHDILQNAPKALEAENIHSFDVLIILF